jgi:MFS family permease
VLVICCLAALPTIVHALTQSLFGGVMTDIRSMLEVSSFGMGVMAAAFNLPSVLLQPGAGALVDRLGAQRMLTAATVGYAACCAWFAFSGSASGATAARLVMGSFAAFLYPAFISVIARLVAAEGRQRAIGLMQMAIGFAGVSGSLLATPVLASDSWRLALGGPAFTARQVLAIPDIRRACVAAAGTGGIMIALGGLLNPTNARVVWKLPESSWGTVNAAFFIGFALGGPILARITRSFGPRRTLCGAIALLAVSLAAWAYLPVEQGVALACAFTFCAGLGASAMSIAVGVAVRAVPVESAGAASGLVVSSMACSGMVIQAAAMATTAIPGTTPVGRSQACAAGVIVVVLGALWVARNVTDAPATGSSR